jgi:putative ABC transport system ATP-binding protein
MELLRRLARRQDCGAVVVSHDERLRAIADRVVWLEDGRVTQVEPSVPTRGVEALAGRTR